MGRIGLASTDAAPDRVYAIIEGNDEEKGIYRSSDFGLNWEQRSDHMASSPQYYNELIVDPNNPDRVYSMDTFTHVSSDSGTTWTRLGFEHRQVDDHALWIDPDNSSHLVIGGDGGIYESFDTGANWRFISNLPIAQFYRIQPDYEEPFYNVCGGTQDNNSLCAPSRTTLRHGITNADWNLILFGDGYEPQFDPNDPDIIYTQYQYGGLARYDKLSGERLYIAPHPDAEENNYKWNWNTPLHVSPHASGRIYYAAEKLFRSDDRGDTWRTVSPDLTRQLDRNELEVMGRVWSVDAVAKNDSTSMYGAAIALSESELVEGLIYVGTDDGVMNVTENGGENWRRVESFRGVPDMSLIEDVQASLHDADIAFATIDNHKRGDHQPYVLRSDDRGRSWELITGDLPERGTVHTIVEDHVDPNLLFVGTEFGLFFTQDGGDAWHELTGGLPTISVRDIEIQRRENDLVVGTFGRGIYILDDYSLLRTRQDDVDSNQLFAVRDPWLYVVGDRYGVGEKGFLGADFYTAPNPPFGAVFTYRLENEFAPARKTRRQSEIEAENEGADTPYPSWDTLRREDSEEDPAILLIVRDADGNVVRQVTGETDAGLHRTAWDLRLPPADPVSLTPPEFQAPWDPGPQGPLAAPGDYSVTLASRQDGELTVLSGPETFTVKSLPQSPNTSDDPHAVLAFHQQVSELYRVVSGSVSFARELGTRIDHLKIAIPGTAAAGEAEEQQLRAIETELDTVLVALSGDRTVTSRNEAAPWSVAGRIGAIHNNLLNVRSDVPGQYESSYAIAASRFAGVLSDLRAINADLEQLESQLENLGAPHTPGRVPEWEQ